MNGLPLSEANETYEIATTWARPTPRSTSGHLALTAADDPGVPNPGRNWVSVVDWQTLGIGLPAWDHAYITATSLNSRLRSTIEEAFATATERGGDDMVLAMLRRGCQAIRDLGTLQLVAT